jgi:hypothetical protein
MPDTTCHMSISLDGFVAGPDQSRENPLGKRGRELPQVPAPRCRTGSNAPSLAGVESGRNRSSFLTGGRRRPRTLSLKGACGGGGALRHGSAIV